MLQPVRSRSQFSLASTVYEVVNTDLKFEEDKALILQDVEVDLNWYKEYFLPFPHENYVAMSETYGPIVISAVKRGQLLRILIRFHSVI